jgi:branched-chain amino acid transport system substrate-binding protein
MNTAETRRRETVHRRTFLALGAGGAAGLLVGLPVRPARGADAKVAGLLALTGTNAAWGQKTANAFQLAWEIINQRGGVKALGGAKVAYTMADTESRPEVAGSQMERLLQGGHAAVIGCNQSAASVVVSQIGERARVPFITPTDVDPLITGRGFKYSFRLPPLIDAYAKDLLGFAAEMGKATGSPARKLAVLCENSIIGQSASKAAAKLGQELGFEVVDVSTYDAAAQRDFSGYVSKYKSAGVDILVGHNKPADAVLITRTLKELDFNPKMYGGLLGGHESVEYVRALGRDADHVTFVTAWAPDLKISGMDELARQYSDRFKVAPDAYFAAGFSAAAVLWDAMERAKSADPRALREALAATELKTGDRLYMQLHGCKFKDNGDNERAGAVVEQIVDGKWHTVAPAAFAAAKPMWPKPRWRA